MWIEIITPPTVGFFIGWTTNWIAIKMLFRPHKAKRFLGVHIPFTPGIIPKEKGRIAKAIGDVISDNLMNSEILGQYLLSESITNKLRSSINGFFETQKQNEESVEQFLMHYLTEDEIKSMTHGINKTLTSQIKSKLADDTVGETIAHVAVEHVINSMSYNPNDVLGNIVGLPLFFGEQILRMVLSALRIPVERKLSRNINDILKNNSEEIVSNLIGKEVADFLNTPVKDLLYGKDELIQKIIEKAMNLYRIVITEHLPRILETVNISEIVCDRINEMDVAETEKLILQVMNKELKMIVWLGAVLGFFMGWINVFL